MAHHYVFGGGISGCLYDYGPEFSHTLKGAIESLVWLYSADGECLADGEEKRMRRNLRVDGIHRFENPAAVGAHYCEVSKANGPCPKGDE